jgi:Na+/melibiose symporter-like transporter
MTATNVEVAVDDVPEHQHHHETAAKDRVSVRETFGLGFGKMVADGTHGTLYVLLNQIYNMTMGVDPRWLSTLAFIQRIWDAMVDPLVGQYSDNLRTRWGRRRPLLFIGVFPLAIFFGLLWWFPRDATHHYLISYLVFISMVFYTSHSIFTMPLNGLIVEATDDYHERSRIAGITLAFGFAVSIGSQWVFPLTQNRGWFPDILQIANHWNIELSQLKGGLHTLGVEWTYKFAQIQISQKTIDTARWAGVECAAISRIPYFSPTGVDLLIDNLWVFPLTQIKISPGTISGVRWVGGILCPLIFIAAGLIPVFLCRERMYKKVAVKQPRVKLFESLKAVSNNRSFMALLWARCIFSFGFNVVGGLGGYMYVYYVWGSDLKGSAIPAAAIGSGFHIAGIITSLFVFPALARRIGKRRTLQIAAAVLIVDCVSKLFCYQSSEGGALRWAVWLPCVVIMMNGITNAGVSLMTLSMVGDIADYDEYQTGLRREGLFVSLLSWFEKAGNSIAVLLTGYILSGIGFEALRVQTPETLRLMKYCYAGAPAIGAAITLLFTYRYNLSQDKIYAIKDELARRRTAIANAPMPEKQA